MNPTNLTAAPGAVPRDGSPLQLGAATSSPPAGAIVAGEPPGLEWPWGARARLVADSWQTFGRRAGVPPGRDSERARTLFEAWVNAEFEP